MILLFVELPTGVVVSVKLAEPLGLLILTNELAGKLLYSAAARLAGVEVLP
jgi:hypothetical protein